MRGSIKIDVFFSRFNFSEKLKILQNALPPLRFSRNLIHIQAGQGSCLDGT